MQEAASIMTCLPNPHLALFILRGCLDVCKVNHLLRSTPLSGCEDILDDAACSLGVVVSSICRSDLQSEQWQQIRLPAAYGGLGIGCPRLTRGAARFSAIVRFLHHYDHVGIPSHWVGPPPDAVTVVSELSRQVSGTVPIYQGILFGEGWSAALADAKWEAQRENSRLVQP